MRLLFLRPKLGISSNALGVIFLVLLFFVLSYAGRIWIRCRMETQRGNVKEKNSSETKYYQRLVVLAPSNVETVFALGLGENVVGVNRYTSYPKEAVNLPKIGGMVDVDFEKMLLMKPDLVILLESQKSLLPKFDELGIKTLSVVHDTVDGIVRSFSQVSELCGNEELASKIRNEILEHIRAVKEKVNVLSPKRRPRVLVCIHHSMDVSQPEKIVICGNEGYHRELVEIAGGVNAYEGAVAFPKLSRENLINMNPDIIIDLVNENVVNDRSREELKALWSVYGELDAVKNKKIVIADGAEHFLPGPRFLSTLDVFLKGIHGASVPRKSKILLDFEEGRIDRK